MEDKGARPKEERESGNGNGGNSRRADPIINISPFGEKWGRPKKQRGLRKVDRRHRKKTTDVKHRWVEESRRDETVRHLSVRLYDVLDMVGASADFRKLRQDCAISREIIATLDCQLYEHLGSGYIFGSSSEGSTTPGMNSDTDVLGCNDGYPVIDNIRDARDGHSLLMIRDKHTKPGYVKLQVVYDGQPQTIYTRDIEFDKEVSDSEGRICLKHLSIQGETTDIIERNGPADTSITDNVDQVYGFKCSKIPEFSTEWIGQRRQYRWPSRRMINKMATMGCFVVGVGHPTSTERNIEWRLSFSLQERELMFSMNIVQHKCYIVLKMIKNDLIEPKVGKSISSYHLKTCMFHTIENTKSNIWKPRNLVQCVLLCLSVLLKWAYEGYCPNYFIKEENMFDRDIHRSRRLHIIRQINVCLTSGSGFLFFIKLDQIGDLLKYKSTYDVKIASNLKETLLVQKLRVVDNVVKFTKSLCVVASKNRSAIHFIKMILKYVLQTKSIMDHSVQQTQKAFAYILSFVHIRLSHSLASLAFSTHNVKTKYALLKESGYSLREGHHCDLTSATLLEVTVFYKLGLYDRCIGVLDQLELKLNQKTLSICRCHRHAVSFTDEHVKQLRTLPIQSIMSRTSTCVMFIRSDMPLIPEALQYEMYRSINTPPGSKDKYDDNWFDLVVVDAVVYLHIMQYFVHAKLNNYIQKLLAINTLESILHRDRNLGHRETGYNLLGCIYVETNQIHKAIECFLKSWQIRPIHNAAQWHLSIVLYKYSRSQIHGN